MAMEFTTHWVLKALASGIVGALLVLPGTASADVELPCTVSFAEELSDEDDDFELDLGRIDDFCECKVVTPGFSRYIQARSNFADVLSRSTDLCPDVASAVSNPAVAATTAAPATAVAGAAGSGGTAVSSEPEGPFARLASLATYPPVPEGRSRCTVNSAMSVIQSGDFGGLCECDVVTLGFVRYLQTRSDIGDILDQTAGQCADLAVVLSETPVAAIFSNRYIASDPRGAPRGTCTESECGGGTSSSRVAGSPSRVAGSPPQDAPRDAYADKRQQGSPGNPDGSTPYGSEVGAYDFGGTSWDDLPDRIRIK